MLKSFKYFSVEAKNETTKVEEKIYSSGLSVSTLSTDTLAKDIKICEEWNLSIDLKLPNRSTKDWIKVFSFQFNWHNTTTTGIIGDLSIPAVWIRPDKSNLMLMIKYNIDTIQSYDYNLTKKVNKDNWINLKISQISGEYKVKIDYELVYNKTNSVPKTRTGVNLVTGTINEKKNISTIVYYRNFKITNINCEVKDKKSQGNRKLI